MTRLRHQILGDDRVLLTVGGATPHTFHIAPAEARRFAWAVLSDLDPDGVYDAGAEAAPPESRTSANNERADFGSQLAAIFEALGRLPLNTNQIAMRVGISRKIAAVQLCRMATRGGAVRVVRGSAYVPGTWVRGDVSPDQWRLRRVEIRSAAHG